MVAMILQNELLLIRNSAVFPLCPSPVTDYFSQRAAFRMAVLGCYYHPFSALQGYFSERAALRIAVLGCCNHLAAWPRRYQDL